MFFFLSFLSIRFQIQSLLLSSFSQDHLNMSRYKKKWEERRKFTNWRFIDTFWSRHWLLYIIFETIKEIRRHQKQKWKSFKVKKRTFKITIGK
jgi:hypothetical protein